MTVTEWQAPVAAQQIRNIYCSIPSPFHFPGNARLIEDGNHSFIVC